MRNLCEKAWLSGLLTLALSLTATHAQSSSPKFEVASIKPCGPADDGGRGGGGAGPAANGDPTRLRLECQTVENFIRLAYIRFANGKTDRRAVGGPDPALARLLTQPIDGGPGWVKGDRYTIDARPASPQSAAMMRGPMLRTLLEDRFQLKVRRDIRDVPVYALATGKGPLKIEASKTGSCTPMEQFDPTAPTTPNQPPPCGAFGVDKNGGMATYGQTMAGLCRQLSAALNRDVVDRTGLTGTFDIHLELTNAELFPFERPQSEPDGNGAAASTPSDPVGAVMAAIRKLGLQLEAAKAQGEFLVIEHIERPTEN